MVKRAQEFGVQNIEVRIKGPGPGRESSVRALNSIGLKITSIQDVTPMPHNGCRPMKEKKNLIKLNQKFNNRRVKLARNLDPKCRQCRREGEKSFFLKGKNALLKNVQ